MGQCRVMTLRSEKLSIASSPLNLKAATSYALAAASTVLNVPNQVLKVVLCGSLISADNLPNGVCLIPLNLLFCLVSSREGPYLFDFAVFAWSRRQASVGFAIFVCSSLSLCWNKTLHKITVVSTE